MMKIDPYNVCWKILEYQGKELNHAFPERKTSHIKGCQIRIDFSIVNSGKSSKFGKKKILKLEFFTQQINQA